MRRTRAVVTWSVLLLLLGVPGVGGAQSLEVICFGSQALNFLPALVASARPVTVSGDGAFSLCLSMAHPELMSATMEVPPFTATLGCGLVEAQTVLSFTWNTGETSTLVATTDVHSMAGMVMVEARGAVTEGLFAGREVVFNWTAATPDSLGCATPGGVTEYAGPSSLAILPRRPGGGLGDAPPASPATSAGGMQRLQRP
ncbi:hypothetical protein LZ198_32850 [Myxococcus sp. K15C18031901]|uniref:hypothetical protein n=1 Tax=Myxococcus dinghuensis TaxID=2906761 RepID=UPI0020A7D183|nr:hypothetical protein [Myxococcus dinghuensis]MCP3103683.1 hypothetical protein [Myxococcus dinghuensis]